MKRKDCITRKRECRCHGKNAGCRRRQIAGTMSAVLIAVMLAGCGRDVSALPEASGQMPADGGAAVEDNSSSEGTISGSGAAGEGGMTASGQPQTPGSSNPENYYMNELYTEETAILPMIQSAEKEGISYKIENVEYTGSFGDRNKENLAIHMSGVETDAQGSLQGNYKYLFLTITFTNTTDQAQEIYRTSNEIAVIGTALNTIVWSTDACYYDVDWEKGTKSQKHHWVLEPGESVTSEVGWVIAGCGIMLAEDDTLEGRMGSGGPYTLYYRVGYDGSNEGSQFIDLGVKVE